MEFTRFELLDTIATFEVLRCNHCDLQFEADYRNRNGLYLHEDSNEWLPECPDCWAKEPYREDEDD